MKTQECHVEGLTFSALNINGRKTLKEELDELINRAEESHCEKINEDASIKEQKNKITYVPPTLEMIKNLSYSTFNWITAKTPVTDEDELKKRIDICQGCEFWNGKGFRGTGRCMKCGCSTWAKLRMATEKCPIGKW